MALKQLTACPFELGQTLRGTDDGTTTGTLINNEVLGGEFTFNNIKSTTPSNGVRSPHTAGPLRCIAIRNVSGVRLYGKRWVTLDTSTAGLDGLKEAVGYADTLAEGPAVLIDEFLSSTGVADKDIFWAVIDGVATTLTSETGAGFNGADIAVGGDLVAATAASSTGSTTGGRVANVSFTNATAGNSSNGYDGYRMARNCLGTALSARTTGETSADLLVRVKVQRLL